MKALVIVLALVWAGAVKDKVKEHYHPSLPDPLRQELGRPTSLATFLPWYVMGVPWCSASTLILSVAINRRELKRSEAYAWVASCVVPVVGGMIVRHILKNYPDFDVVQPWEREALTRDRFGISGQ